MIDSAGVVSVNATLVTLLATFCKASKLLLMFSVVSEILNLVLGYCFAKANADATLTGLLPVETENIEPAVTAFTCIVLHDRHHDLELEVLK